jgi:SET domain-containing protein
MNSLNHAGRVDGFLKVEVEVRESRIDGKGLFAQSTIEARQKLGELGGELIKLNEARKRARQHRRIAIVELGHGKALDSCKYGNALRYINHSCSPNTFMRIVGTRVEVYALRQIRPGEEFTCDYGDTQHDGNLPCRCGSGNCRKFI